MKNVKLFVTLSLDMEIVQIVKINSSKESDTKMSLSCGEKDYSTSTILCVALRKVILMSKLRHGHYPQNVSSYCLSGQVFEVERT